MYRIGIDVGGTFTDLVAIDAGGATVLAKVPSTPEDPSLGGLHGKILIYLQPTRAVYFWARHTNRPPCRRPASPSSAIASRTPG